MSKEIRCFHCNKDVFKNNNEIIEYQFSIYKNNVYHNNCLKNLLHKLKLEVDGRIYECPKCDTVGKIKESYITEERCSFEEAMENAGYAGAMSPQYTYKKNINFRNISCDLCKGYGYTKEKYNKTPIVSSFSYIKE